ncbi:MAG: hypothetical protein PVG49_18305 [Desulfobacteraceae bacterium]
MSLWDRICRVCPRSLAVFGMAKNAGKTVSLNHIAVAAEREGRALGLTSIGRDGETWDVLTYRRKPAIQAEAGTLIATAEMCLDVGTAVLETVEQTSLATPLGPVVMARVRAPGTVEVAGPSRAEQLHTVVDRLLALGAELVLVDGAIDRQSLASPRVTQGCVLATGAILNEDLDEVVRITQARVQQLILPATAQELKAAWRPGRVIVRTTGDRSREIEAAAVLKGEARLQEIVRGEGASVLVGGALTDSLLLDLMGSPVRVVVRDATCLFVDHAQVKRFLAHGGVLEVVKPLQLIAVTVNPVSPEGWAFDARTFFEAVRDALDGVPVYDVVAGFGGSQDQD